MLEAAEKIELARINKGITLRGAFGSVFRKLVCQDQKADCRACAVHPSCPYGFIFTPTVPHCSLATTIGLCIREKLSSELYDRNLKVTHLCWTPLNAFVSCFVWCLVLSVVRSI